MIHSDRYEHFLTACQDIFRHRDRYAKPAIDAHVQRHVDEHLPNDALLSHIIAESLMRRLDRNLVESKNIYLQTFDVSQIDLFYLMCRAYPQVPESHHIANQMLVHELRKHRHAVLMDIGVGKGVQMANVVRALAEDRGALDRLELVAMDPNPANLEEARKTLEAYTVTLDFSLHVHTVQRLIEQCKEHELRAIADLGGGVVVLNSAYSMHHMVHKVGDNEARTDVLRRIGRALSPRLFTLVEPNANHDADPLTKRFHACWEHFGTVFELIDEARELDPAARFAIKEKFFGREIRDIFGTSDAFRCERHELVESWLLRLTKAGFRPYERVDLSVNLPSYCTSVVTPGLVRLGYRELPLVAVFAYQAHDRVADRRGEKLNP